MMVTFQATVHNSSISLFPNAFLGNLLVRPVWVSPVRLVDLAELDRGAGVVRYRLLEGGIEVAVIQEDVWVVEPAIEMSLDALDRLEDAIQLLVTRQHHERSICPLAFRLLLGVETAVMEDFVVFLVDFAVRAKVSPESYGRREHGGHTEWMEENRLASRFRLDWRDAS
jgi:hypothetical protein